MRQQRAELLLELAAVKDEIARLEGGDGESIGPEVRAYNVLRDRRRELRQRLWPTVFEHSGEKR